MNVRSTQFGNSILVSFCTRQFVGWILAFSGFKLVSLLEAHLEIVLPLRGYLQVHCAFIVDILCWLRHTALMLGCVVELVSPKGKIRLGSSVAIEYLICIFFALPDCKNVVFLRRFRFTEAFLCRTLREVKMLGGHVRPAKLIRKFLALSFRIRVKWSAMVLVVVFVLWKSIESVCSAKTEVILLEVILDDDLLRIPFLTVYFLINAIVINRPSIGCIAELEVRWLNLLSHIITDLFGNVFTDFLCLLVRLSGVVGILATTSSPIIDLAVSALS